MATSAPDPDGKTLRATPGTGLSHRLEIVRREYFGDGGIPELAVKLGIPARTWMNYEAGVMIPGSLALAFVELTDAEPAWLLRGEGPRYRPAAARLLAEG